MLKPGSHSAIEFQTFPPQIIYTEGLSPKTYKLMQQQHYYHYYNHLLFPGEPRAQFVNYINPPLHTETAHCSKNKTKPTHRAAPIGKWGGHLPLPIQFPLRCTVPSRKHFERLFIVIAQPVNTKPLKKFKGRRRQLLDQLIRTIQAHTYANISNELIVMGQENCWGTRLWPNPEVL